VTPLFSVWANGDTITAGADTAVYVSTNGGVSFTRSAKPVAGVAAIEAVRVRNGRVFAGTFGQGVHISDDLGTSWHAFNEGLVGGILNSQLDVVDFQLLGTNLIAGTAGAGVYARNLAGLGVWQPFGGAFEPNQASNVNSLAQGGTRLLACAGSNGMVFIRDPGDADWSPSNLDNIGIHAGWSAMSAIFTGTGWVVGTNNGVFHSVAGREPWTRVVDPSLGVINWTTFAAAGHHVFEAFDNVNGAVVEESDDDGATFQNPEGFAGVFIQGLAISGSNLYAARADGLWRRPIGSVSTPIAGTPRRLRFSLAGPQPFGDATRLRFVLPEAGSASIAVFDIQGREVGSRIKAWWSAGPHEIPLDARHLSPGVYSAVLTAAGTHDVLRLVHVR
jgi:hypothetical protein